MADLPHESDPLLVDILASLESELLALIAGPLDAPIGIRDVAISDRSDIRSVGQGTIVLAVGCSLEEDDAAAMLKDAARCDAAAIVFRTDRSAPERIEQLATSLGIAVLSVSTDVRWEHAASLIRTAMAKTRSVHAPEDSGIAIGDLFGLADAIAAAVGGPVTIEDPHWRLLAYSNLDYEIDEPRRNTILGRTPPSEWRRRIDASGIAAALRSSDNVIRFTGDEVEGFSPRLVAPIRAGDELLGALWVAETGSAFDSASEHELARAAKLATVHFLSHRASEDIKRRTRGAFVREVLEGWAPAHAGTEMLRASGPFTALVFAADDEALAPDGVNPERVLSIVSLHCEAQHRDAICARIEDRVWSVLPAIGRDDVEATRRLAERTLERVEGSLGVRLVAAIGTTVPSIPDIPQSRRAAEQALDVLLRRRGTRRVVHIEDVQAQAILLEILDVAAGNEDLAKGRLAKLLEHDRAHGTSYGPTLRAYLDAGGNIRTAAARLFVHPNTIRQRLQRITKISGLDLDDPDERLVAELQLRMRHV